VPVRASSRLLKIKKLSVGVDSNDDDNESDIDDEEEDNDEEKFSDSVRLYLSLIFNFQLFFPCKILLQYIVMIL
jgi:hypothetical protein